MACKWAYAQQGMKFALTELGGEQARIRDKFREGYENRRMYETSVPVKWVESGWVKEIAK